MIERAIGLLVLSSDETCEQDMRRLLPAGELPIHTARVANHETVTTDSLSAMGATLTPAAASLPQSPDEYAVIGYGCTSATAVLGSREVARLIGAGVQAKTVTTPLDGLVAVCAQMGLGRLAIVSPYLPSVGAEVRDALVACDIAVPALETFAEPNEAAVARMPLERIAEAACRIGRGKTSDAVFLSCTNLPTLSLIPALAAELGKPVLSSNLVLAWHMRRLARLKVPDRPGAMLR